MNLNELLPLVILGTLLIFALWYILPRGLFLFSPATLRIYFETDENKSGDLLQNEGIRVITSQLLALGFSQIGVKVEKMPLWGKGIPSLSFASLNARTYASLYVSRYKVIYYYLTAFSGGQVVLTASDNFPAVETEHFIQSTVAYVGPEAVLAVHQKQVEKLRAKGFIPVSDLNRENRITATSQYYNADIMRKQMRLVGLFYISPLIILSIVFIATLIQGLS
jgi:hypothetical protein